MGTGSFPGVKRPGCDVDNPPHLAARLKKVYNYASTLPPGFHGIFYVNCTFTVTFYIIVEIA
jgi:hypothetical protein